MKTKKLFAIAPELYLMGATLYYWVMTANVFNPIAISLLLVLTYQLIYKKLGAGLIIASVFILLNLFMVLALISELGEFTKPTEAYQQLLIFGSLFLGINLVVGVLMLWKYVKKGIK